MINGAIPAWASTKATGDILTVASLTKLAKELDALPRPDSTTLHVREISPEIATLPKGRDNSLCGMPIKIDKNLPATVKDKDGNEVELIGLMVSETTPEDFAEIMLTGKPLKNRLVMLTGKIVKAAK